MKFLSWWIREGFKWAQQAGQFLAEWLPRIADFLGGVISALGGLKPILVVISGVLATWFAIWSVQKAAGAARGIMSLFRGGRRLIGRIGGRGGRGVPISGNRNAKTVQHTKGYAEGYDSIWGKKSRGPMGAIRGLGSGLRRFGSGLATRTGGKAAVRLGSGFLARRGAAMGAGAAAGAGVGALGFGVGAIPGAVIGAVAGLVVSQAAGVALDAATGQSITMTTALLPGAAELRDIQAVVAAGTDEQFADQADQMKAMAAAQQAEVSRNLDQNYAALIGRPDSIIPSTMGTLMGVYASAENRATEVQNNLDQQDTDDGGFWSGWGSKIKGAWNTAWGTIQGWWNKFFGNSPGASTADGGNPDENAVDYDGGSWWSNWLGSIGGFFKGAWGTVKGWWNKITGGAEENQPTEENEDDDTGSFFPDWLTGIGGWFKSGWSIVKGWWNKVTDGAEENQPTDPHEEDDTGSFFPDWLTGIGGWFKSGWSIVKGWWNNVTDGAEDNQPTEENEDDDTGSFFPDWLTGIGGWFKSGWGIVKGWWNKITGGAEDNQPKEENEEDDSGSFFPTWLTDIGGLFKDGWGIVKGWWNGLRNKNKENKPEGVSDPPVGTIGTSLKDIIGAKLGAAADTIKGLFKGGVSIVTGWWQGLKDKSDENKPQESDSTSTLSTLGSNLAIIRAGLKSGIASAGQWISDQAEALHQKAKDNIPGYGAATGFLGKGLSLIGVGNDANVPENKSTGGRVDHARYAGEWNTGGVIPGIYTGKGQPGGVISFTQQMVNKGAWQTGGVIPGPQGMLGLAAVHSGETILPTHLGPDWVNSTKGGNAFKRMMGGDFSGGGGWGTRSGGTNTTNMTMNRPTIINISTTESTSEVLTALSQLEMLEDAAFFSSLA